MEAPIIQEKNCVGQCPSCGSECISWHDSEIQDGFIIYNATCDNCDQEFQEEYTITYAVTTYVK